MNRSYARAGARTIAGSALLACLFLISGCWTGDKRPPAPSREQTLSQLQRLTREIRFAERGANSDSLIAACQEVSHLATAHFFDTTRLSHDESAQLLEAALGCVGDPDGTRKLLRDLVAGHPTHWFGPLDPARGRDDSELTGTG